MASERVVGGLTCAEVLAHLGDFLDGELAPEVLTQVRAHVAGCGACERFGGAYAAAVTALRATEREAALDAEQIASIVASAASAASAAKAG